MPLIVQSHSQSLARLMFVTSLQMDHFDCTKMNACFNSLCMRRAQLWMEEYSINSTFPPYVSR